MKNLMLAALTVVAVAGVASTMSTPALALGECGPNEHRDANGKCVAGGQNEDWCLRETGHTATRMPNGSMRCVR